MKITHAVTLVSTTGAYGGPVSVASGQLRALAGLGHDVCLISLWDGPEAPPTTYEGSRFVGRRARTFIPRTGFLGLFNVAYPWRLWTAFGASDVVHIHTGRDLASLAALLTAALRRKPTFVQTHGMVSPRTGPAARLFDLALRPLMRRAATCFVLTDLERSELGAVLSPRTPPLVDLPNGVALDPQPAPTVDDEPVVLYLARMHERKRPRAFVAMADLVHSALPNVHFDMYGPDEGELPAVLEDVKAQGLAGVVTYRGAISHEDAQAVTSRAAVYVLPSVNEPFPMSLLEALAVETPVVCTDSTGISDELGGRGAASVTDGSPRAMADAVIRLLSNAGALGVQVHRGRTAIAEVFSVDAVAAQLQEEYERAVGVPLR